MWGQGWTIQEAALESHLEGLVTLARSQFYLDHERIPTHVALHPTTFPDLTSVTGLRVVRLPSVPMRSFWVGRLERATEHSEPPPPVTDDQMQLL